jgi:hypothetical protein
MIITNILPLLKLLILLIVWSLSAMLLIETLVWEVLIYYYTTATTITTKTYFTVKRYVFGQL